MLKGSEAITELTTKFHTDTIYLATTIERDDKMSESIEQKVRRRFRWAGASLVLSGLLLLTSPFLIVGTITPPDEMRVITETSAVNANSIEWRVGMAISFVSFAFLMLGWFGLYARLARTDGERWALGGLIVTIVSLALYLPLLGVVAYVLPAVGGLIQSGQTDALVVLDRTWMEPLIFIPFFGGILENIGVAMMGVGIWRSGTPSKWGGIVLVAAGIIGIPAFLDVVAVQYVSPVVLAIGLIIVGVALWRSHSTNRGRLDR